MNAFSRYFLELASKFFEDVKNWFVGLFNTLFKDVWNNFKNYFLITKEHSQNFDFVGWLMFILTFIIIFTFLYFLIIRLIYAIRRYIKFQRTEIEKDDLKEEIAVLNEKVLATIDEKNKILAMKVSQLQGATQVEITPERIIEPVSEKTRFSKLRAVDLQYNGQKLETHMRKEDEINLEEITDRFVNFAASSLDLFYDKISIRLFLASMSASKVIILEGVSGTGKTSLPYAFGRFFKKKAPIISVQPSWRERAELLGYFNEFTKKFNETDFLKALYEANYRTDVNLIVLDEMNLARIEYYFAEFLSIMELPDTNEWKIDLVPDIWENDPKLLSDGKVDVPQNTWFIGTANKDDSTFTITDKVYDRAMIINFETKGKRFESVKAEPMDITYDYLNKLFKNAQKEYPIDQELIEKFNKLDQYIYENLRIAFGNRIIKQMETFIPVYNACGGTQEEAIDYLLTSKILRKYEVLNISFLRNEIDALIEEINRVFGKNTLPKAIDYLKTIHKY